MVKIKTILMFAGCLLLISGCALREVRSSSDNIASVVNPVSDNMTEADAAQVTGYDTKTPDTIGGYTISSRNVINNGVTQVIYGEDAIVVRKASGISSISGDYNDYAYITTDNSLGYSVTLQGYSQAVINLATWTKDNNSFSVSIQGGTTSDKMLEIVTSVQ